MVRSYVKIYGPPVVKAIKALEAVAVDMSSATSLKFSHRCIPYPRQMTTETKDWNQYLKNMERTYVECYEPVRLISQSQELLGEHDFFLEWVEKPKMAQIEDLLGRIDKALEGMGCYYTLMTK